MKVKDAIKRLQSYKNQDEDLIIAWWFLENFTDEQNPAQHHEQIVEQWESICDLTEHKMDWSGVHDDIHSFIYSRLERQ
jgi:hypothetical protein